MKGKETKRKQTNGRKNKNSQDKERDHRKTSRQD
jgi:hypothetical protein